ncbi:capsule biosynthesis protein [Ensifer sp. 22521]|uniref:capsule biosynthesis protein n=1 Tax=Ensifer sp. 22521 TaxID=3453935 RepID=UPI000DDF1195
MPHQSQFRVNSAEQTALEVSRGVSVRLAATARKLRFSTSSRSEHFNVAGLRPKLSERLNRIAFAICTVFLLIFPNIFSLVYYGFIASDQYQSETRFTVRTSTPALGKDQLGKATGIPAAKIVQDTQIVAEFITSRAMLDSLRKRIDLRAVYGRSDIDLISRLAKDAPSEDLLSFWQKMVSTSISPSSGIITVKARAFSSEEAQRVLTEVVRAAETAVNDMNYRIWRDVTDTAQKNLDRAAEQLRLARGNLQVARNQSGMLSVEGTATVIAALIENVERERLDLQQKYDVQVQSVGKDAPQLRVLRREIASKEQQVKELRAQLAGGLSEGENLAQTSTTFAQRQMEQGLAEQQFTSSVKTMEQIKFVSRQQLLYLDAFLLPDKPDKAKFPKRVFWILVTLVSSLVLWAMAIGTLAIVRRRIHQ